MATFPLKPPRLRRRVNFTDGVNRALALVAPFWESEGDGEGTHVYTPRYPGGLRILTPQSAPTPQPGRYGPQSLHSDDGLEFYELDDPEAVGTFITNTDDQPFTALLFCNPNLTTAGDIANTVMHGLVGGNDYFWIYVRETGEVNVNAGDGTPQFESSETIPTDGSAWTAIVVAWSPDMGTPRMWLNGVEATAGSSASGSTWASSLSESTWIGGRGDTNTARQFNGELGIFAGWGRVLTDAEVRQISADPYLILREKGRLLIQRVVSSQVTQYEVQPPQHLKPTSDVTVDGWEDEGGATTNLYQSVDEDPEVPEIINDADYVISGGA